MTIIHPSRDSEGKPGFAAIPLYPEALGKYENENRIYCKEISLKFTSSESKRRITQINYHDWANASSRPEEILATISLAVPKVEQRTQGYTWLA